MTEIFEVNFRKKTQKLFARIKHVVTLSVLNSVTFLSEFSTINQC